MAYTFFPWISNQEISQFVDYCIEFYGPGGVYANDFRNGGFSEYDIEEAVYIYLDQVNKGKYEWGGGDSVDREFVRDILMSFL
jgi:hypothetical protein